jgi:hypothetical protein
MTGSSQSSRFRWLKHLTAIVALAAAIGLAVWYLRPSPLLSADDPPDVVYQKVFEAYGGQASWERWRSGRIQYDVQLDPELDGPKAHFRDTFQLPGKLRKEMTLRSGGVTSTDLTVVNGDNVWIKAGAAPVERRQDDRSATDDRPWMIKWFHPVHLLEGGSELTIVGAVRGNHSTTDLVLKVRYDDMTDESECRIDVRSGMIREFTGPQVLPLREETVTVQYKYTEFKGTPGGPVPHRIIGYENGVKVIEIRFITIDLDTPVDPSSFLPPTDAPRP